MTMRFLLLPLLAIATPVAAQSAPYRALGTEPFWSLQIDEATMRLDEVGRRPVVVAAPLPRPSFNGRRYPAAAMTVDITRTPCGDGMSDRRYPETVTVQIGRRTLHGCGGAPTGGTAASAVRLTDTRWTIAALDGRAVTLERPTSISFDGARIGGNAGCNRFGGDYTLTGNRLTTRGVFATRMACPGEAMRVETRVLALLDQPLTVTAPGRDTLVLAGGGGSVLLKRVR